MKATLSVVIASKNCEARIIETILPWKNLANEIIVVDQESSDNTAKLAKNSGAIVIVNNPENGNFDLNRKLGLQTAKSDWILYIDTDERPTQELLEEIKSFLNNNTKYADVNGVRIPNLFYFIGKPLKYGIYNKNSAEIRMFRKNMWNYPCEKGFHHSVSVQGATILFQYAYKHFNVNSISEWFIKTNQYTEHDAKINFKKRQSRKWLAFFDAVKFFIKYFIFKKGYRDGFHGFLATLLFMSYHFILQAKLWEYTTKQNLKLNEDYLDSISAHQR